MTYNDRMRWMVELGQMASNDASIRKTSPYLRKAMSINVSWQRSPALGAATLHRHYKRFPTHHAVCAQSRSISQPWSVATIENFLLALNFDRRHLLPTTRAILTAVSEDQLTITLRIGIIVLGLPWEEVTQELVELTDSLHADALGRAQSAIQQAIRRPDANLFSLEMTLSSSNDERLRRLALAALIAQSKQVNGWSDERISRLQAYREDTSPLVAEAAQFTFV
jgi:hypothetical protein